MSTLELIAQKSPLIKDIDGVFRVGGTRVRLETVIEAYLKGYSSEAIHLKYPSLNLEAIKAVINHYLLNRAEIETYLAESRLLTAEAEKEIEARFPSTRVRERLLERRRAKQ